MKKSFFMIAFVLIASFSFGGCWSGIQEESPAEAPPTMNDSPDMEPQTNDDSEDSLEDEGDMELTLEELAEYDGTNGKRAFVAIDGIIYDVTDSEYWNEEGPNNFKAGRDVTGMIGNISPSIIADVAGIERIGILVD